MNFIEKFGLLWVLYWFTQSTMYLSAYLILNRVGDFSDARGALILSVPGIILFLIGNHLSLETIINKLRKLKK